MNVKLVNKGATGEFFLEGRLDSDSAPDVEKLITGVLGRFETVILNLQGLAYTSSAGLRVFLSLTQKCSKEGKELIVSNVAPSVMEVLEITGFAGILNIK